ncbi:hypothetical protein LG198_00215 [Methylobacillus arboreus]|uniref:DUF6607 family protein n=1 Tax=Methylobacillus arboreus TaxID=755170 RepID=UPI001E347858|nr:DUF6607 family protein [Methylobacillus arboreus]MCB5189157.1 hypothetical protein [Methylobacillus arboreus]
MSNKSHKLYQRAIVLILLSSFGQAHADTASDAKDSHQYTFSWQFQDESSLRPRGGTTRGAPVDLVTEPSAEWIALQQSGISDFERDRRAILAMAGEYRATFDFVETTGFVSAYTPTRPYRSWGTEKVYVVEDTGKSIVLQHLLVMSFVDKNGKVEGPIVTKHWRQDWQYEASKQLVFRGNNTWQKINIPSHQQQGTWKQTVYQVDDSPRYSGVAKWQHFGNYSSWSDEDGWRPLPRREYSVRDDYDVLIGNNRHIINPTGWTHEQQNLKVKLDRTGQIAANQPVLARESGFNRYERIRGHDWSAGDRYFEASKPVWSAVKQEWDRLIATTDTFTLRGSPDKDNLFIPIYQYAQEVAQSPAPPAIPAIQQKVHDLVKAYLAPAP